MAKQGILAKSKPSGATNTLLYSAPIDSSASTVLTVNEQGGSGTTYDVALKNYDQKMTLGSSNYLLHEGDVVTGYRVTLNTPLPAAAGLNAGTLLTSTSGEETFKFESFYLPAFTEVVVKVKAIRALTLESTSGTFAVGETFSTGTAPNATTATIFAASEGSGTYTVYIGPSTINGSGAEFAAGDSVSSSGSATGTISTGGIGAAVNEFTFTESGGTEDLYLGTVLTVFSDRVYRFNVADSSLSGLDFSLSTVVNGEWGPDGTAGNSDDGTEYTTGRTTNGTAGSSGAYVQYDFTQDTNLSGNLYVYEGTTGTAGNSAYGGSDRFLTVSNAFVYSELYVYDITGTWTNSTDSFLFNGVTYTVTAQTTGAYGYIRSYSGAVAYVIKGTGSADFTTSSTFQDNPKLAGASRTAVTVSSIDVATNAVETQEYLRKDNTLAADSAEEIKSLVIGPGERLIVECAAAEANFVLIGFEDASTAFTTRTYEAEAASSSASG
tara:strand:+ start:273 stop:1754 length:1482 start_codon:yes stop_codon:yes gene_type:complete